MVMQQNKGINKISTISSDEMKNVDTLFNTLTTMKIARIGAFFDSVKRCGENVSDILMLLLLMPFFHLKSVPLLVNSPLVQNNGIDCGNSVFYDLKNNPKVNWRSLLYLVALRFRNLSGRINPNLTKTVLAFIIDDSPLPKTSHKTELVSRVHDHVSRDYILGYKLLVIGYWDGLSFYPIDFSIHREKGSQIETVKQKLETANKRLRSQRQVLKELEQELGEAQQRLQTAKKNSKNDRTKAAIKQTEQAMSKVIRAKQKLKEAALKYAETEDKAIELRYELKETKKRYPEYGLTKNQMSEQFRKLRNAQTPGAQRVEEADMKKTTCMMDMIKRAIRRGFQADYVLTDSWFCSLDLIKLIASLNKKHNINLLTMAKMGINRYQLTSNNQSYNAHELLTKFERKAINARSHKAKYFKVAVTYGGIRINLFFVKMGRGNSWKLLITTDLTMGFQKLMNIYQIRWSIEVFFRESKQYLNLGKCKSTCFDAQIADTTISMVQYVILSFHQRISEYGSFDGVFASALEDAMQSSMASEMQKLFWLIVEIFCENAGVDIIEFTRSLFRDENACIKLQQFNPIFIDGLQKQNQRAA